MIDYKLSRVKVHLSDRSYFREKETKKQRNKERKEERKKERKKEREKSKLSFFLERVLYKEMNPRPWNFVLRYPTTKFSMLLWIFLHL